MSVREWISITWAEWCPSVGRGRLEVGDVIIMSRAELGRTVHLMHDVGVRAERQNPGRAGFATEPREELAEVHNLRRV